VQGKQTVRALRGLECEQCHGVGFVRVTTPEGIHVSRVCGCQQQQKETLTLHNAQIPPRYQHCTIDNFDSHYPGAHPSLASAQMRTRAFVASYPLETRGLLLTGSIGAGKTHLAVSALLNLIADRRAQGLFCDYRDLLRTIQDSYNPQSHTTELQILRPVMEAEVLLLDDLGAIRPSEWVWDTVSLVLNARYNNDRTTIITTNYAVAAPKEGRLEEETLADRIGERMRSRLMEMCQMVSMSGVDFRCKEDEMARPRRFSKVD